MLYWVLELSVYIVLFAAGQSGTSFTIVLGGVVGAVADMLALPVDDAVSRDVASCVELAADVEV